MKCFLKASTHFPVNPSVQIALQGRRAVKWFLIITLEWMGLRIVIELKIFRYGLRIIESYQFPLSILLFRDCLPQHNWFQGSSALSSCLFSTIIRFMLMLPMQFPLRQPRLSRTSPPYLKKLPSSSSRVCTGMELSTCTYSCRTTTRKRPAIFHKIELGICLWSLHAVLSTIFFLMCTSRCKDLVHVKNWSLSVFFVAVVVL